MRTILVLLALGLAACGHATERPAAPHGSPAVMFEHSGGYASQPRRLVVDGRGHARLTVTTGTKVSHSAFTLSPAQREDLTQALDAARGVKLTQPTGGCADCFTYLVKADGVDFYLDEVALQDAPAPLKRVVTVLEKLSSP